jgi:hypothetical protein
LPPFTHAGKKVDGKGVGRAQGFVEHDAFMPRNAEVPAQAFGFAHEQSR